MQSALKIRIRETFTHINAHWPEEEYKKCRKEWNDIKRFISGAPTPYHCGNCMSYWSGPQFVNDHYNICPNCDTWCQPFLCNPINHASVEAYISPDKHEHLLDDNSHQNIHA